MSAMKRLKSDTKQEESKEMQFSGWEDLTTFITSNNDVSCSS